MKITWKGKELKIKNPRPKSKVMEALQPSRLK